MVYTFRPVRVNASFSRSQKHLRYQDEAAAGHKDRSRSAIRPRPPIEAKGTANERE